MAAPYLVAAAFDKLPIAAVVVDANGAEIMRTQGANEALAGLSRIEARGVYTAWTKTKLELLDICAGTVYICP